MRISLEVLDSDYCFHSIVTSNELLNHIYCIRFQVCFCEIGGYHL